MAVRNWQDHRREIAAARNRHQRRIQAQSWARAHGPAVVQNLGRVTQRQPGLRPGVALAAAAGGVDDDLLDSLARLQRDLPPENGRTATARPNRDSGGGGGFGGFLRGIGRGIQSAADFVTPEVVEDAVGQVASRGFGVLDNPLSRSAVRGAMPFFEFGPQAFQGMSRIGFGIGNEVAEGDFGQAAARATVAALGGPQGAGRGWTQSVIDQTDVGQAINSITQGEGLDLGDGFLPDEESDMIVRRKAAERGWGTIDGHSITLGRGLANIVFEPGTKPYDVLSGLADAWVATFVPSGDLALDAGLRAVRNVDAIPRLVGRAAPDGTLVGGISADDYTEAIGGFGRAIIKTVDPERALQWLDSERGGQMVNWFASKTGDAGLREIWQRTKGKLDPDLIRRLGDSTDPTTVRTILGDALLEGHRPELRGQFSHLWARKPGSARMFGTVPPSAIDLEDGHQAVKAIDDFARNVKLGAEDHDRVVAGMIRAQSAVQRREAYHEALRAAAANIIEREQGGLFGTGIGKIDKERAFQLTQYMADDQIVRSRAGLQDMIASGWGDDFTVHMGSRGQVKVPGAHILAETAETLPMPNARDLKRATSFLAPIWELQRRKLINIPKGMLEFAEDVNGLWKTAVLMRGAYPIRVVAIEESLRMAAAGYNSVLSHPISYFSMLWGDPRKASRLARKGRLMVDALGDSFDEAAEFRQAMSKAGMKDEAVRLGRRRGDFEIASIDDANFPEAWADELATLASDEVVQAVARADSLDDVMARFGYSATTPTGAGAPRLSKNDIRIVEDLRALGVKVDDPAEFRGYLESIARRLRYTTGGDETLMAAVRNGAAEAINNMDLLAKMDVAPPNVTWRRMMADDKGSKYDRAIETMFNLLASRPTDRFSRSPVFRQAYARRLIENASLAADPDDVLDAAKRMKFNQEEMDLLTASLARRSPENSLLGLKQLDAIAKGHALNETKDLLYDLHNRSQFFSATRLVFPFGEAWKEVVQTWAGLATRSPGRITRRAAIAADAAQDEGIIYESPVTGEMSFAYPMTAELNEALSGLPFEMEGRVAGLNIAGEVLPGVGLVAQLPLAKLMPDDPDFDGVRDLVFPFGEPENPRDLAQWMPSFVRSALRLQEMTAEEQRLFGNTTWAALRHLASTGAYDLNGPDAAGEQQRLLDDAKAAATRLQLIRSAIQFGAPSSPSPVPTIMGPNGELVEQQVILDRYNKMLEEDPENAVGRLLDEYGWDNLFLLQGNTIATVHGGVPLKGEGFNWVRANEWVKDAHPEVYGFFAPQSVSTEFNYEAYKAAIESGELEALSNKDKLKLANHRAGSAIYRRMKAELEATLPLDEDGNPETPTDEQEEWLRQQKLYLMQAYPGYNNIENIGRSNNVASLIDQGVIDRALADERFLSTADPDTVDALQRYWAARSQVVEAAGQEGTGMSTSTSDQAGWRRAKGEGGYGRQLRWWLRGVGDELAAESRGFAEMWDSFLSREFIDDIDEQAVDTGVSVRPAVSPDEADEEEVLGFGRSSFDDDEFEEDDF